MAAREMSSEDFRAHLYHSLQGKGILDSLKSQLRNRLATEIQKTLNGSGSLPGSSLSPSPSSKSPHKPMRVRMADSLVAEYLKAAGYEYSLSIFLPEAGITIRKLFSEADVFQFLRIPSSSDLHRHITSHTDQESFLERLLEALIDSHTPKTPTTEPAMVQSPNSPSQASPRLPASHCSSPGKKSVAVRLEELDVTYARKAEEESLKCQASLDDRLLTLQRDLEARYKHQLESELTLYQTRELAKVRQEERDRYREELAREREGLQQVHQLKLEEVKRSEQHMLEKYRRKEQELESGVFAQRQTLLDELNALRVKGAGLKREVELDRRALALEKEQVRIKSEQLETNLKQMKARFQLEAEEKLKDTKATQELELKSKRDELLKWETRLKRESENVDPLRRDNKKLAAELSEQRVLVEKLQAQLREASRTESGEKKIKFAEESQLKRQVAELRDKLSQLETHHTRLKSSHSQQQLTIKQQQAKLSQPDPAHISLQAELEQLRKAHHKQMLVVEYDNKQLGRQLAAQTDHTLLLQRRLDEQLLELRVAQREVQDLQALSAGGALHRSQSSKAVLKQSTSSTSRKANKPPVTYHSAHQPRPQLSTSKPTTSPLPLPSHVTTLFRDNLTSTLSPPDQNKPRSVSFYDSSGAFLAESRATIERMEKEAQEMDRTYHDFTHQHMASTAREAVLGHAPLTSPSPSPVRGVQDVLFARSGRPDDGGMVLTSPPRPVSSLCCNPSPGIRKQTTDLRPTSTAGHYSSSGAVSPALSPSPSPPPSPVAVGPAHTPRGAISDTPFTLPRAQPPVSTERAAKSPVLSEVRNGPPSADSLTPSPVRSPRTSPVPVPPSADSLTPLPVRSPITTPAPVPPSADSLTPLPVRSPITSSAPVPVTVQTHSNPVSSRAIVTTSSAHVAAVSSLSDSVLRSSAVAGVTATTAELQVKPRMSLDNWWKSSDTNEATPVASKAAGVVRTTSLQFTSEIVSTSSIIQRSPTEPLAPPTYPAETVLIGATRTPILSVTRSSVAEDRREGPVRVLDGEDMGARKTLVAPPPSTSAGFVGGGLHEQDTASGGVNGHTRTNNVTLAGNRQDTRMSEVAGQMRTHDPPLAGFAGGARDITPSEGRQTRTNLSPPVAGVGVGGGGDREGGGGGDREEGGKKEEVEEEEMDSIMLKYMQLVKEKREQEAQHADEKSITHSNKGFDVPPLSEDVSRFDGLSDQGDDPFEDW